jgi:hypothetical protein
MTLARVAAVFVLTMLITAFVVKEGRDTVEKRRHVMYDSQNWFVG